MCGISGYLNLEGISQDKAEKISRLMGDAIQHRGPDATGFWFDSPNGVVLSHRRLAVLDVTKAGNQPMTSNSGRYVLVFNGEIYNHQKLRKELSKIGVNPSWESRSDTETLLALFDAFGFQLSLNKLVGMFAIALWDKEKRTMFLARDRVGEKPLYYGSVGTSIFFASELKSLRALDEFFPEINRDALSLFFKYNYIPQPHTIYKGVYKLPPGHYVELKNDFQPVCYWDFVKIASKNENFLIHQSEDFLLNKLDSVLSEAVSSQMQADVPLGGFLSGGIDSSLVVAMMQEHSSLPIDTFSIGFENKQFDEAHLAKAVAHHLGTKHHELYVSPRQALDIIPQIPLVYDEPFSDSSQIPTILLSQMTRKHVTVSLSGDGGDELFGGYNRYIWGDAIWKKIRNYPFFLRYMFSQIVCRVGCSNLDQIFSLISDYLPHNYRFKNVGSKLLKLSSTLQSTSPEALYEILISHWNEPEQLVIGCQKNMKISAFEETFEKDSDFRVQMMKLDAVSYLPDDIMVKVDRAAMSCSLETRMPFLDPEVMKLAWRLPMDVKIRGGVGKWCLREILYRRVPRELVDRPKMGFGVPIGDWLKGPLRGWAEEMLDKNRIEQAGYLDVGIVRKTWEEHLSGKNDWQYHLWDILMFESWREQEGL